MDKKLYPRIGEEVIWETLDNGLPVTLILSATMSWCCLIR